MSARDKTGAAAGGLRAGMEPSPHRAPAPAVTICDGCRAAAVAWLREFADDVAPDGLIVIDARMFADWLETRKCGAP